MSEDHTDLQHGGKPSDSESQRADTDFIRYTHGFQHIRRLQYTTGATPYTHTHTLHTCPHIYTYAHTNRSHMNTYTHIRKRHIARKYPPTLCTSGGCSATVPCSCKYDSVCIRAQQLQTARGQWDYACVKLPMTSRPCAGSHQRFNVMQQHIGRHRWKGDGQSVR